MFDATHEVVLRLADEGLIDGFRVDHPDGLADPRGYFRRLADATGGMWVVAEKIPAWGERLPADWPVAGTTGYDALRVAGGLFVDPAGAAPLTPPSTRGSSRKRACPARRPVRRRRGSGEAGGHGGGVRVRGEPGWDGCSPGRVPRRPRLTCIRC